MFERLFKLIRRPSWLQEADPNAPLGVDERRRAAAVQVWHVWYEDQFGEDRDSFPVSVCLTNAEADAELARRGRNLQPGWDGYVISGPSALDIERRPSIVREVLRRLDAREPGPVHIPSELW